LNKHTRTGTSIAIITSILYHFLSVAFLLDMTASQSAATYGRDCIKGLFASHDHGENTP